jgi:hypothetical protein
LTLSCSMNFSLNLLCSSLNSSTCLAFSANDFWACNNCSSFESTDAYKIHPQKPHQSVSQSSFRSLLLQKLKHSPLIYPLQEEWIQ